jgi:curved DNA-binding protein CbpA
MNDLYEVLQVRRGAEPEVIRAAYRALARKHHPDFGGSPERMAAINEAWAVLGNPVRRASYDSAPRTATTTASTPAATSAPTSVASAPPSPEPQVNGTGRGLAGRRPQAATGSGTVLDFGRYAGWTVGSLVNHDPDYLEWLSRTPIGRRLTSEIDAALARRQSESEALRPSSPAPHRRRSFIRPWAASAAPAR